MSFIKITYHESVFAQRIILKFFFEIVDGYPNHYLKNS